MIEIEHLTKRYGAVTAVSDLSLQIDSGRTSVLLHAGTEDLYRLCGDIFLACAENNAVLLELTPRRASLEDVFLELNAGQPEPPAADEDTDKDKEARS